MNTAKPKAWALHTSHPCGEADISLHKTEREALEEIASVYDIDTDGMTDEQIDSACYKIGVLVTVREVTLP